MPKITCGILCLYVFIIGVICEICGSNGRGMNADKDSKKITPSLPSPLEREG
jgi:hypothetical protein